MIIEVVIKYSVNLPDNLLPAMHSAHPRELIDTALAHSAPIQVQVTPTLPEPAPAELPEE